LIQQLRHLKQAGELPESFLDPDKPVGQVRKEKGQHLLSQGGKLYNLKGEEITTED
jgi:hypothetical protein